MKWTNRCALKTFLARKPDGSEGFNLIEMMISMAIVLATLLGVMASLSTASIAEINSSESVENQFLLGQTLEELKNNSFDTLLSFNGTFVTSGSNRADISVDLLTPDLARIQVVARSTELTDVTSLVVLLVANTN
ncbi:MAG TPA: prepilin-type N-terminal cleavage/methylation domain-containing protein [Planctomycetota bacterium]|nr:prepilin-type N-terminal cleavage/methylation domain-containing protein [Planctomycetota bacterium]